MRLTAFPRAPSRTHPEKTIGGPAGHNWPRRRLTPRPVSSGMKKAKERGGVNPHAALLTHLTRTSANHRPHLLLHGCCLTPRLEPTDATRMESMLSAARCRHHAPSRCERRASSDRPGGGRSLRACTVRRPPSGTVRPVQRRQTLQRSTVATDLPPSTLSLILERTGHGIGVVAQSPEMLPAHCRITATCVCAPAAVFECHHAHNCEEVADCTGCCSGYAAHILKVLDGWLTLQGLVELEVVIGQALLVRGRLWCPIDEFLSSARAAASSPTPGDSPRDLSACHAWRLQPNVHHLALLGRTRPHLVPWQGAPNWLGRHGF